MKKQDFYFDLPHDLIAQYPLPNRRDSRLLHFARQTGVVQHHRFEQLADLLLPGDLLIMNDSRVVPARFYGIKSSGGRVEFLVERIIDDHQFWAHIRASKAPKPGSDIHVGDFQITVLEKKDAVYRCVVDKSLQTLLDTEGHIPLPPYIERGDETLDLERYQTIYARHKGSVAAPTAGLHFDDVVMTCLGEKGIDVAYVTLHVGAGTFQPVRVDDVQQHKMHSEVYSVSQRLCDAVAKTRERNGRVIAVGTTAMRCLESAARDGVLKPIAGETDIFILPGYQFKVCDGLLTNFHLPESTLLMLVSAFIGHDRAMSLYQEAIQERYRFFSYGDVSLLL